MAGELRRLAERLEILPQSAMLTSRYRVVRAAGHLAFAFLMLFSVGRPKWLMGRRRLPSAALGRHRPEPPSEADVALCARLIDAYRRAAASHDESGGTAGMWEWIFETRQKELAELLAEGNPTWLAEVLASMFTAEFVLGMGAGPLIEQTRNNRLGARAWELKCLTGVVSLAEYCGTVPVEALEQGESAVAFREGLPALVENLEGALRHELDFPSAGGGYGLVVGERVITPDTPDQIYAALRLEQAIGLHLPRVSGEADADAAPSIVEIGGGYGGMCFWFAKRGVPFSRYTIIDLPIVNVFQGYFLSKALGAERVSLFGEEPAELRVLSDSALAEVETPVQVMMNKDSMPEMPEATMKDYLAWGASNCSGLFYSYNQETAQAFLDEAQGAVPRAAREVGGLRRISRDRSWVRDGYVEEIYLPEREPIAHTD